MANSTFEVLEFRAVIEPDLTHLYIRTSAASDGMLGVGGWYHKVIPASKPAMDVLRDALVTCDYLTDWDRGGPQND